MSHHKIDLDEAGIALTKTPARGQDEARASFSEGEEDREGGKLMGGKLLGLEENSKRRSGKTGVMKGG